MKKLVLALAAVASVATANAQSWLVYGNANFTTQVQDADNKTLSVSVNPGIGYNFNEHWAAGVTGSFGHVSSKVGGVSGTDLNGFTAGAFGRYTKKVSPLFSFFGQLEAGYARNSFVVDLNNPLFPTGGESNGYYASLVPAVTVNLTRCMGMNFSFGGLSYSHLTPEGANDGLDVVDFTFGKQFNVGAQWTFGGHKMHGHHAPMDETRRMSGYEDDNEEESTDDMPKKKKAKHSDED